MEMALLANFAERLSALETSLAKSMDSSSGDSESATTALSGLEERLSTLEGSLAKLIGLLSALEPRLNASETAFASFQMDLADQRVQAAELRMTGRRMVHQFNQLASEAHSLREALSG